MGNKISKIIDKMKRSPADISFNEVRDIWFIWVMS
jgi:hypothetical protein